MIEISASLYGVIIGGIIGFIAALPVSILNNRRADKRLVKQLEQSEKNLRIQLYHDDQKKLLLRLDDTIKDKETPHHQFNMLDILEEAEAEILPDEFKDDLKSLFKEYEEWCVKNDPISYPEVPPPEPDYDDHIDHQYHQYVQAFPEEKFKVEKSERYDDLKKELKNKIRNEIKGKI